MRLQHQSLATELSDVQWIKRFIIFHQMRLPLEMRAMECPRLRIKDFDFERWRITAPESKGDEDRATMLPLSLHELLKEHLVKIKLLHEEDNRKGFGSILQY
jgi:integrase